MRARADGVVARRIAPDQRRALTRPAGRVADGVHWRNTEMLYVGADVRYVQEMLGHAHIQTTRRYTKIVPVDLQEAVKKAHPSECGRRKEVEAFEGEGKARFYRSTRKGLARRNRKRRSHRK